MGKILKEVKSGVDSSSEHKFTHFYVMRREKRQNREVTPHASAIIVMTTWLYV